MKLRDFINQHRDAFDVHQPGEEVWNRIEAQLPHTSPGLWNNLILWRIAAALLLGLSVYLWGSNPTATRKADVVRMEGEFKDLEKYYNNQIAEKTSLIEDIEPFLEDDHFAQDLQKLDAMYEVLREQMKTQPSEKVKDALVLNLLVRIDLLNQQLKKVEESRQEKNKAEASNV